MGSFFFLWLDGVVVVWLVMPVVSSLVTTTTTTTRGVGVGCRRRVGAPCPRVGRLGVHLEAKKAAKKAKKSFERKGFGAAPPCPCGSGLGVDACCDRVRRDRASASPAEIVRSRYTAYARGDWEYIIATTDPRNSGYAEDKKAWFKELEERPYKDYRYLGAEILEETVEEAEAAVTFRAKLKDKKSNRRADFTERSVFAPSPAGWLYLGGDISINGLVDLKTGETKDGGDFGLDQGDALADVAVESRTSLLTSGRFHEEL